MLSTMVIERRLLLLMCVLLLVKLAGYGVS